MMKQTASILGYCAACILIGSCFGQSNADNSEIVERHSEEEISLAFKRGVISIYQDSNNDFWIGSKEEGVCKYDGQSYTYFTTENGLAGNAIRKIQEDPEGNIWFSTNRGICYYNGQEIKSLPANSDLDFLGVSNYENPTGSAEWSLSDSSLWFQLHKDGILRHERAQMEYLAIPIPSGDTSYADERAREPYFYPYSPVTIYLGKNGHLLIGTFNRGVVIYDGNTFEYHNPDGFGTGTIRGLFQDSQGDYWFGSNGGGLYRYNGVTYQNLTREKGLTGKNNGFDETGTLSRVWSIGQDVGGNMWFGTAESGLWKYDGYEMINYTVADGLPSNFVETIYRDKTGKMWFCSGMNSNGKLYTYDGELFEIIN